MNLKEKYEKLRAEIKALAEKSDLSEDEAKKLEKLMEEAKALKSRIELFEDIQSTSPVDVEAAVKAGVEKALKELPAVKGDVQVTKDGADQPFPASEYFAAVKTAYLYPGNEDARLRPLKATGLSEGVPADGGYLLAPQGASGIIERMYKAGEVLQRVSADEIGPNSNSMLYNAVNETSRATGSRWGGLRGYLVAEAGTITASRPAFRQMELKLKKVAALCYSTDEQLADTVALASWLNRTVPE